MDERMLSRYAAKFGIPAEDSYLLDTSFFTANSSSANCSKQCFKDHWQPLQALYFDKEGKLVSWLVNCYAGGFPNLNWNRNGRMDQFVPLTMAVPDTGFTLRDQLAFLQPASLQTKNLATSEYTVVVYWSRFMGRQSKKLVKAVQENCLLAGPGKVRIIYANNDNLYVGLDK